MTGSGCVVQNYTDTNPPAKSGAATPLGNGIFEADLEPWQALECEFINDNTAFLKIIKNTTENSPDVIHNLFNFTYEGPAGIFHTEVNVTAGFHSNMTEVFTIPAGNYNVTEDEITNWVLQSSTCTVYDITGIDQNGDPINPILNDTYTNTQTQDFDLQPWQLAVCEFVNDNSVGYFTGGGRVNLMVDNTASTHNAEISLRYDDLEIDKVTHGFQLHCSSLSGPNNLEVNWLGYKYHLEQLENALCYSDGTVNEPPAQGNSGNENSRKPILDVYYGEGYGRYEGECGAYAKWVMDDNGEPGKADQIVSMVIWNRTGDLVLNINPDELDVTDTSISGEWNGTSYVGDGMEWLDLESGNQQWTPHPFKAHGKTHTTPCAPEPLTFDQKNATLTNGWEDPLDSRWD
jgi:hypothetical protein